MAKPQMMPERSVTQAKTDDRQHGNESSQGKDVHKKHGNTMAEARPEDVTGINPEKMAPIDARMVYMPPP